MPPVFATLSFESLTSYLTIGAALFALGMLGAIARRNLIVMFLSVELMLQGAAVTMIGFGQYHGNWTGQIFTIVMLAVAASEAALALALILVLFKRRKSLDASLWQEIRDPDLPPSIESERQAEPLSPVPGPESYPHLTPAGVEPPHPLQSWEQRRD